MKEACALAVFQYYSSLLALSPGWTLSLKGIGNRSRPLELSLWYSAQYIFSSYPEFLICQFSSPYPYITEHVRLTQMPSHGAALFVSELMLFMIICHANGECAISRVHECRRLCCPLTSLALGKGQKARAAGQKGVVPGSRGADRVRTEGAEVGVGYNKSCHTSHI